MIKGLLLTFILLFTVPVFAQEPSYPLIEAESIDGVYFGVTFKKTLETKNSILQAGYLFNLGKGSYLSAGLDYDYNLDVSSVQPNFFYKVKPRIYATAGVGADFHNTDFNNTVQLSGGFAYVPDFKFFGSMELAIVANVQYTGWFGFGRAAQLGGREIEVDNTTDGAEIWLSFIGLGF